MLLSERINNLIITIEKMKSLETNYLGRKYLEQFTKITVKSVFTKVENHLREELLNIELEGIELVYSKANY